MLDSVDFVLIFFNVPLSVLSYVVGFLLQKQQTFQEFDYRCFRQFCVKGVKRTKLMKMPEGHQEPLFCQLEMVRASLVWVYNAS